MLAGVDNSINFVIDLLAAPFSLHQVLPPLQLPDTKYVNITMGVKTSCVVGTMNQRTVRLTSRTVSMFRHSLINSTTSSGSPIAHLNMYMYQKYHIEDNN